MNFHALYQSKRLSADEAVTRFVKSGDRVFLGGLVIATEVVRHVVHRAIAGTLQNICLVGNLILSDILLENQALAEDKLRYKSFFYGGYERAGAVAKNVSFVPLSFSNYARYMQKIKPNVVIVPTSYPDENGNLSLGPQAPYTPSAISNGKIVIAQVNRHIPRVYGMCMNVPMQRFSAFVEFDEKIPEYPTPAPTEIDNKIAAYILEHIPDGACLQLGLGSLTNAVGFGLRGKKHLGIHTEMLTESMVALILDGSVDNSRKSVMAGTTMTGFTLGKQSQYDFVNNNSGICFAPYEYVNNPHLIAQNDNMISINNALSVDLTGQACAETIGYRQFSGTGGQVDYVRGAFHSKGGKSFIAISSLANTKQGSQSRIVLDFPPGSTTTTLRTETQYIVTEFGCAEVWGEDLPTRAKRLIAIAHPDFREQLTFDAKRAGLLY